LVRFEPKIDLAVLKTEECQVKPTKLAKKEPVSFDPIFSIGSPGAVGTGMATSGVVGKYGYMNDRKLMISTMPINLGNSGGPVFNKKGELVGITVALRQMSESSFITYSLHVSLSEIKTFLASSQEFDVVRIHFVPGE
jgi:S1-C subfamily serine protease